MVAAGTQASSTLGSGFLATDQQAYGLVGTEESKDYELESALGLKRQTTSEDH